MEIKRRSFGRRPFCATAPIELLERTSRGAVDGFTICPEPRSDLVETLGGSRGNNSLTGRTDIEQKIPAFADNVHECAHRFFGRFPFLVTEIIAPVTIERHARF